MGDRPIAAKQHDEGATLAALGRTLASIARVFRTSVSALQTWNGIDGTRIMAGERLTIYTARSN